MTSDHFTSKNLQSSTELTLIANVKPGLIELPDPMSYGSRIKKLLGSLFDTRKAGIEEGTSFAGPLERLRVIHFVRWAVFDDSRRLLLAVSFDRPWEPYIRQIVDEAGPILDVIFSHCEGYEGHTTRHGYQRFGEWVRAAQKECDFFFAAFPGLKVDDIHYLKRLKRNLESCRPPQALPLEAKVNDTLFDPLTPPGPESYRALFSTAVGLYRLRSYFLPNRGIEADYDDRAIYDRACGSILRGLWTGPLPKLPAALGEQYNGVSRWYEGCGAPEKPISVTSFGEQPQGIQAGIVSTYRDGGRPMSHGCFVMLAVRNDPKKLFEHLERRWHAHEGQTRYNVAFTPQGLERIGQPERTLRAFPDDFRQGMEARAGLLGDLGSNHPSDWRLPTRNFPPGAASGAEVPLSSVDVVILLQKRTQEKEGDHEWSAGHPLHEEILELSKLDVDVLHVQPLRRYDTWWDPATEGPEPSYVKESGTSREHFGFLDGFSQPDFPLKDRPAEGPRGQNEVAYGEVFVGQPNDRGEREATDPLLADGTFLAVRKLSQDVSAFRTFVAGRLNDPLAAKMMGRTPTGEALALGAEGKDNDFDYEQDRSGLGCPLQSHVRLANPRTQPKLTVFGRPQRTPRILRRGFPYGSQYRGEGSTTANDERGLLFLALGASLGQQYEVIQRWLNGANSTGLDSSQSCPITGPNFSENDPENGGRKFRWRDGSNPRSVSLKPFVKLEWGMYLFMPTRQGLQVLAAHAAERVQAQQEKRALTPKAQRLLATGQRLLGGLLRTNDPEVWRQALEEQGSREATFAILTAIRANHRVLRTPIGVIVAGGAEARQVLSDEATYSVREYFRRMKLSHMQMHLGMDREPAKVAVCPIQHDGKRPDQGYVNGIGTEIDYARESIANTLIRKFGRAQGFAGGRAAVRQACVAAARSAGEVAKDILALTGPQEATTAPLRATLDLWIMAEKVVSGLSNQWFGLPDRERMRFGGQPLTATDERAYCPADFTVFSQYVFRPVPDDTTAYLSAARGLRVAEAATAFVRGNRDTSGKYQHPFLISLAESTAQLGLSESDQEALIVRSLVGTVDGFVAAAFGSFLSVMGQWLGDDDFWRLQISQQAEIERLRWLPAPSANAPGGATGSELESELLRLAIGRLCILPKPAWLLRTATRTAELGGVVIEPGDKVIVHLGQAALETQSPYNLFGNFGDPKAGNAGPAAQVHACPGQEVALGVLLGMLVGILELKNVRQVGTLTLEFEPVSATAHP